MSSFITYLCKMLFIVMEGIGQIFIKLLTRCDDLMFYNSRYNSKIMNSPLRKFPLS